MKMLRTLIIVAAIGGLGVACGNAAPPPPAQPAQPAATPAPAPEPAVARGRDLEQDQRAGGHTLTRHVGRTDAELRQRLRDEPGISAASTYSDKATAERVVAAALEQQRDRVAKWQARTGNRPNLTLHVRDSGPIGRSIERRSRTAQPCHDAVVVLRWKGDTFFVLTSYPETQR